MKRVLLLVTLAVVFLSCAKVNYIGLCYPPTRHIDLYFSVQDVKEDYQVIGRIVATARVTSCIYSDEKFQKKVIQKAREKGADGVIVLGFDQVLAISHDMNPEGRLDTDVSERRRVEALAIRYVL